MLSQFFLAVKVFSEKIQRKDVSTCTISDGAVSDNGIFHSSTALEQKNALLWRWPTVQSCARCIWALSSQLHKTTATLSPVSVADCIRRVLSSWDHSAIELPAKSGTVVGNTRISVLRRYSCPLSASS
jgi:hypothetical protein